MNDVSLQINLCAGDLAYAALTVPRLVAAHPGVEARHLVVDCCRPQRTRIFDPDTRLPEPAFNERLAQTRDLAKQFQAAGLFDEITWLEPGSKLFRQLARRYCRPWMTDTHDYGGCAFMGYWAALDAPRTRFVIHYDADMLLHQAPGFDWARESVAVWPSSPDQIAACPRISPPGFAGPSVEDAPSLHEGRPRVRIAAGWLNDWFSTRCFLFDRERLEAQLPLVRGRRALEQRVRKWIDRGYPPGPEQLLHRVLGGHGLRCLQLADPRAWLLHPTRKGADFLSILPDILRSVSRGDVPSAQRGYADLQLEAWAAFLTCRADSPSCASS